MQVTGEGGKGTVLCQHAWAMRKIYFSAKGLRFSPGRNKAKEPLQTTQVHPYRRNRFPQNLSSLSTSIIKLIMLSQRKKSLQLPSWHFQWERPSVSSYPGGTWLSDWWPQCIHWTCPLLCCMPDSRIHPSAASPQPARSPPELLGGLKTSLAETRGPGCPFPLLWPWHFSGHGTIVLHLSKRGLHHNTHVLHPQKL